LNLAKFASNLREIEKRLGMTQTDLQTTVADLKAVVEAFVGERDWHQFHSPKNLSMALAIEAAELMEHFQWITIDASRKLKSDPDRLAEVGEELADVLCYAFAMANELGLDISQTVQAKMVRNAEKYPVEKIKGRYGHDDPGSA
jgi:NTP pyrophosphatase (non-canonical NTP hydrolase)